MAGLIPRPFIDELLDRVDIVEVVDSRVPLKRTGRNLKGLCPFHKEKTPSFTVNADKQFYYCFGCGAGGNAIGFLMEYDRLDFPAAVESLAHSVGLEVPREESGASDPRRQHKPLYDCLAASDRWFQQQLRQPAAKRAVDYLKGRGLSGQIARRFNIGYAPPGWNHLETALAGTGHEQKHLLSAGMLVRNEENGRIYDRFRDRIMFPIRDVRGRVVGFGGRVLGDEVPKYLNSPETPVFSKSRELYGLYEARNASSQLRRLLVVEGYMDVVALAQHGIDYAVATLGTAVGTTHLQRLYRHTSEVVFCFDGDAAGRAAAERALTAALPEMQDGRQAWFLFLPEGEDPDSLVRSIGRAGFERALQDALPLSEFLFNVAARGASLQTVDGRARLSQQAIPMLARLPEGSFRQLAIAELAKRTGLAPVDIRLPALTPATAAPTPAAKGPVASASATDGATAPTGPGAMTPATPIRPHLRPGQRPGRPAPPRVEITPLRRACGMLFFHPGLAAGAGDFSFLADWNDPEARFLHDILHYLQEAPHTTEGQMIGYWLATDYRPLVERLIEAEELGQLLPRHSLESEFADTIKHLAERHCRQTYQAELERLEAIAFTSMSPAQKQRYGELRRLLGTLPRRG